MHSRYLTHAVAAFSLGTLTNVCMAQEDYRHHLDCSRRIDIQNPVYDDSKRTRASLIQVCIAPDGKRAAIHFLMSAMHKQNFPDYDHAPWFSMSFKDGIGQTIWDGHIATGNIIACGGYYTHVVPGPDIDWNKVKIVVPRLTGGKAGRCTKMTFEQKLGKGLLNECKKMFGTTDDTECVKNVGKAFLGSKSK